MVVSVKQSVMIIDPDHSVIDRIVAGDASAYAMLVNKHKSYTFTIALRILQVRADAEEAAQDAFIKAYHNLKSFNKESKFSTWLYRIVFNTAVSYKRKQRQRFQDIENTVIQYAQEAEGMLEKTDKRKFIAKALAALNEADRMALSLFYLEEFSLEEISEITGIQHNTLKVRLHRARVRLAEELKTILQHEATAL